MVEKTSTTVTKRARRKLGANPSQLWPQMPKISTASAREKAYLRVAGLTTNMAEEPLDPKLDLNSPEIKFGQLLASPEQRIRHTAVRRLNQYLTERCVIDSNARGLSELDLLKLWKGLWYTLYMADRVPVQEELSRKLSELLWCVAGTEEEDEYAGKAYLDMYGNENVDNGDDEDDDYEVVMEEISNTVNESNSKNDGIKSEKDDEEEQNDVIIPHCRGAHLAALLVKTFFQTIRREWGRMDKYRIDKFYTLIRFMMRQIYSYMAKRHWNLGIIRLFNDTIYEQILSQIPNGIRLHLIDLTLKELATVNVAASMPLTEATFLDVLGPYMELSKSCDDKLVQARVVEKILLEFLEKYSVVSDIASSEKEEREDSLIFDQVHVGTVADLIFTLGSDTTTGNSYRESLYDVFKEYKRCLKKVGKDVVLVNNDEDDDISLEENVEHVENEEEENVRAVVVNDPMNLSGKNFYEDDIDKQPAETKKKSRRKRAFQDNENDAEVGGDINEEHVSTNSKKAKKGRKKKKVKNSANVSKDEELQNPHTKNEVTALLKRKTQGEKRTLIDQQTKSDQQKEKKAKPSEDNDQDEIINISLAQQKHAVANIEDENQGSSSSKTKKKKKKKRKKNSEEDIRRVSFGKFNHSKSHRASMRALKTMPSPKLKKITPEKSILRSSEKGRKKATDYFE